MLRQERTPRAYRRAAGLEARSDERSTLQREALLLPDGGGCLTK
ncbi:MAG: hypothetical protein OES10_01685 [Gammaproteobacteria bacterium]|nr:hypothetical protein [Gammaproteobacteria bacterium]MDH3750113.1 hypothetical protein [Gammaproteobacteria bacterium]